MKYTPEERGEIYADILRIILNRPEGEHFVCNYLPDESSEPYYFTQEESFPEWFKQKPAGGNAQGGGWWKEAVWVDGNEHRVAALLKAIDLLPKK